MHNLTETTSTYHGAELALDDFLCDCSLAVQEANYIANTLQQKFAPLWQENDPRKGQEFIHDTGIAIGIVCERMRRAVQTIEQAQAVLEGNPSQ